MPETPTTEGLSVLDAEATRSPRWYRRGAGGRELGQLPRERKSRFGFDTVEKESEVKQQSALALYVEQELKGESYDPYFMPESLRISLEPFLERRHCHYELTEAPDRTYVRDPEKPGNHPIIVVPIYFEEYLANQKDARVAIAKTLRGESLILLGKERSYDFSNEESFIQWLKDLHSISVHGTTGQDYFRSDVTPGKFHTSVAPQNTYPEPFAVIQKWSTLLRDPFRANSNSSSPDITYVRLPGIPPEGCPKTIDSKHVYPSHEYHAEYLKQMHRSFIEAQNSTSKTECVERVAQFLQYAANSHVFEQVNFSLFMNLANSLLETHDISGVPHDHIDYAAMVLQPQSFVRFLAARIATELNDQELASVSENRQETLSPEVEVTLINGKKLQVATHMTHQLKRSLENPSTIPLTLDQNTRSWSDSQRGVRWYMNPTETSTSMVFERDLTVEDIEYLSTLFRYQIIPGYLAKTQEGQYVLKVSGSFGELARMTESRQLTADETLRNMVLIRQRQLDMGNVYGITEENFTENVLIGESYQVERELLVNPSVSTPQVERRARAMRDEALLMLEKLLEKSGMTLETVDVQPDDLIFHGNKGMIYKRVEGDQTTVVKTFPLLRPDDLYQIYVFNKYFHGENVPGFPKIIRLCVVNGTLAAEMEYVPDLTPANKFTEMLPPEVIEEAVQNFQNFEQTTGHVHGDIHEENIQIQTITHEDGSKTYKVWMLDACGLHGAANRNSNMTETPEVSKVLHAINVRYSTAQAEKMTELAITT